MLSLRLRTRIELEDDAAAAPTRSATQVQSTQEPEKEADVDVLLPVKVGHVLDTLDHQFAVHLDKLPPQFHADHVREVMPIAVGQVEPGGHLYTGATPGANADITVSEVDVPVVAATAEIGVHHAK